MEDTICAIATSLGVGAISIIRLSGKDAIEKVNSIFSRDLTNVNSHSVTYGHIVYKNEIIDEVLVTVMRAPKTYTTEDIVEINSHGGYVTSNKILEILLEIGCKLAEPGEFTKRAFLNGRINLIQSEAVNELIKAKTDSKRKLCLNQIGGNVTKIIDDIREDIVKLLANIEVNIDYPEYEDNPIVTTNLLNESLNHINKKIETLKTNANFGKIICDGINVAIIGKPNVGKSSILNNFLDEEKAIVTDIAGTTRDVVEGKVSLDGILLNMIDTAGIRETDNIVESLGVEKAKELIHQADLVLLVIDGSQKLDSQDQQLLELTKDINRIIIINKVDLGKKVELDGVEISAKEHDIMTLTKEIKRKFDLGQISDQNNEILTNARQTTLLEKAAKSLNLAIEAMKMNIPADLIVEDLYDSWSNLKEILGEQAKEDLLDELFKRFCIGK